MECMASGVVLIFAALVSLVGGKSTGCGEQLVAVSQGKLSLHHHVAVDDPNNPFGYRRYNMFVPTSYKPTTPVPLVLDFHGFLMSGQSEAMDDGIILTAEKEGFIMVFPNGGSNDAGDMSSESSHWWSEWNGGGMNGSVAGKFGKEICSSDHYKYDCYQSCARAGVCEKAQTRRSDCGCSGCADDVGFVESLLKKVKSEFCIDEARVHATGMSSGAIFVYYLATTHAIGSQLASIVPVAGSFLLGFLDGPKSPIHVMDVHGRMDHIVPANVSNSWKGKMCPVKAVGKHGCTVSYDGYFYHKTSDIFDYWSASNNCMANTTKPVQTPHDGRTGWSCVSYGSGCVAEVRSCTHDLGHHFPFRVEGRPRAPEFGEVVWDFIKDKRLGGIMV